jgi:hypothetical protein
LEEHNRIIQFEATGQVLIQDSYILEIQSQRINKEEQRNKRIIENANRSRKCEEFGPSPKTKGVGRKGRANVQLPKDLVVLVIT